MCSQLLLNNVSLTYYNPYQMINCSDANTKTIFAFNGYPNITAVAYNATAFHIPGEANLQLPSVVAADYGAPCTSTVNTSCMR